LLFLLIMKSHLFKTNNIIWYFLYLIVTKLMRVWSCRAANCGSACIVASILAVSKNGGQCSSSGMGDLDTSEDSPVHTE